MHFYPTERVALFIDGDVDVAPGRFVPRLGLRF